MRRRVFLIAVRACGVALAAAVLGSAIATPAADEGERPEAALGLGWLADRIPDPALEGLDAESLDGLHVRVLLDWSAVEAVPGELDWGELPEHVERLDRAGARVALVLMASRARDGGAAVLPSPFEPGAVESWTRFVRAAVERFGGSDRKSVV